MRCSKFFAAFIALPLTAQAANIVLSNDDGWAEINIRTLFNVLTKAGENVVLCAPAVNKSGSGMFEVSGSNVSTSCSLDNLHTNDSQGSLDLPPTTLTKPCEYDSCPAGSPPYGNNASNPRLNYVNSYPVTSIRYGIKNLSTPLLGGPPDLALSGFNVGGQSIHHFCAVNESLTNPKANTGISTFLSGTVGAACEAAKLGYPAIALSGSTGNQTAWNAPPSTYQGVYADLSLNITQTLLASVAPYLPPGIWLNVNFSPVGSDSCTSAGDFGFVLSRIYPNPFGWDVETCGNDGHLPTESTVMGTSGCWASVSVAVASTKLDAGINDQAVVMSKLGGILTCLPNKDKVIEMPQDFGH